MYGTVSRQIGLPGAHTAYTVLVGSSSWLRLLLRTTPHHCSSQHHQQLTLTCLPSLCTDLLRRCCTAVPNITSGASYLININGGCGVAGLDALLTCSSGTNGSSGANATLGQTFLLTSPGTSTSLTPGSPVLVKNALTGKYCAATNSTPQHVVCNATLAQATRFVYQGASGLGFLGQSWVNPGGGLPMQLGTGNTTASITPGETLHATHARAADAIEAKPTPGQC